MSLIKKFSSIVFSQYKYTTYIHTDIIYTYMYVIDAKSVHMWWYMYIIILLLFQPRVFTSRTPSTRSISNIFQRILVNLFLPSPLLSPLLIKSLTQFQSICFYWRKKRKKKDKDGGRRKTKREKTGGRRKLRGE